VSDDEIPLARLFAAGLRSLIDDLHERLAARGWAGMRPEYGYVLNAVRLRPTNVSDVAAVLGVTKQAASQVVDAMAAKGWVRREAAPRDGRTRLLVLTDDGEALLADVAEVYRELEAGWAAVVGDERVAAIRADLVAVLRSRTPDGSLPVLRRA
jgi:DNA-binding MarR family transcriptional regulator